MYKLVFYVPDTHLDQVKQALFTVGAGQYGDYDQCCWQVLGEGQFRPLANSKPFIGDRLTVQSVAEYKVEMICHKEIICRAVLALLNSHPYQQPAYQVYPFLTIEALSQQAWSK